MRNPSKCVARAIISQFTPHCDPCLTVRHNRPTIHLSYLPPFPLLGVKLTMDSLH